jgi:hypothetical protein
MENQRANSAGPNGSRNDKSALKPETLSDRKTYSINPQLIELTRLLARQAVRSYLTADPGGHASTPAAKFIRPTDGEDLD